MDQKLSDIKRAVEILVDKRQHMFSHVLKIVSQEGGFWLNNVHLIARDIKHYHDQDTDYKQKVSRLFCVGLSVAKLLDVSNVNNTVYGLLQIFEEL